MDVHCITIRLVTVKYIPGLAFKKQAEAWKARVPDWVDRAFDGFKANMAKIFSQMIFYLQMLMRDVLGNQPRC
jgi:hypothetical protein